MLSVHASVVAPGFEVGPCFKSFAQLRPPQKVILRWVTFSSFSVFLFAESEGSAYQKN